MRAKQRDLENRQRQLEESERDAAATRADLEEERAALDEHIAQAERDLARRRAEADARIQAILIAAQMDALFNQLPDEVAFATAPHPELYQTIDSSQQLSHIQKFDVLSQNVSQYEATFGEIRLEPKPPSSIQ